MCEIGILSEQRTDLVKTVYYKLCYMIECYLFLALIFPFPPPQGTGSWQTATRHSSTLQPAPSASSPPTPLSCSTCPTLPAPEIRGWGGGEGQGLEKQFLFKKYVKFKKNKKLKNKVISGSLATLNLLQPVVRRREFKDRVGVGACVGVLKENTIAFYLGFLFCFVFWACASSPGLFFFIIVVVHLHTVRTVADIRARFPPECFPALFDMRNGFDKAKIIPEETFFCPDFDCVGSSVYYVGAASFHTPLPVSHRKN